MKNIIAGIAFMGSILYFDDAVKSFIGGIVNTPNQIILSVAVGLFVFLLSLTYPHLLGTSSKKKGRTSKYEKKGKLIGYIAGVLGFSLFMNYSEWVKSTILNIINIEATNPLSFIAYGVGGYIIYGLLIVTLIIGLVKLIIGMK